MDPPEVPTKTMSDHINNIMTYLKEMQEETVAIIIIIMCIFIIICIGVYSAYVSGMQKSECSKMDTLYKNTTTYIKSINDADPDCGYLLRDYYIKTAYNCCSGGSYKNDYVDTCILADVIKQGVRCLDVEIYSIDEKPVIATSTEDDFYIKETYNSVPFSDFMDTVVNNAFSTSTAPNPTDPIIIHMRIKSTNQNMMTNMASILKQYDPFMLGPKYSYEFTQCNTTSGTSVDATAESQCVSKNLGGVNLLDLKNKIIIVVDRSNSAFIDNNDFYEYVNLTSNSVFMRCLTNYDVKYTPDMNELITYNKRGMTMCIPDNGSNPDNPSGLVTREMGCQMMAMRYNVVEQNLEENNAFFENAGYAFALKPERLRYIAVTINVTEPNDPLLSFTPRTTSTDYYNFTM